MLEVKSKGVSVAHINKQHRGADGFVRETPWLLLYITGRIERFALEQEAKAEARKTWPAVTFHK